MSDLDLGLLGDQSVPAPQEPLRLPDPLRGDPAMLSGDEILTRTWRQQQQSEDRAMMAMFEQQFGQNPDLLAESRRLGIQFGLDTETVAANIDKARAVAAAHRARMLAQAPYNTVLRRQLTDPDFVGIASDDWDNLSAFGRLFRGIEYGQLQFDQGQIASKMVRGYPLRPEEATELASLTARLEAIGNPTGFFANAGYLTGQMSRFVPRMLAYGTATGLGAAGVAALAGQAGPQALVPEEILTVPGAFLAGLTYGSVAGGAALAWQQEAGGAYLAALKAGYRQDVAQRMAVGVGFVNALIEVGGGYVVAGAYRRLLRSAIMPQLTERLARPVTSSAAGRAVIGYAKAVGTETGTEVAQELTNVVAEDLGALADNPDLKPDAQPAVLDRLVDVAVATAQGMMLVGIPGAAIDFMRESRSTAAGRYGAEFLKELQKTVRESKVGQRSPESLRSFVAKVANNAGVTNLYVDAGKFAEVLKHTEIPPAAVQQALPGLMDQLRIAGEHADLAIDVVIRPDEFAAKLAAGELQELGNALLPHMRVDQFARSEAEAKEWEGQADEFAQEAEEKSDAEAEKAKKFAESFSTVRENLRSQIIATKRLEPSDVGTAIAPTVEFIAAQAETLGLLPHEFFERYPLKVRAAPSPDATAPSALFEGQEGTTRGSFDPRTLTAMLYDESVGRSDTVVHELTHYWTAVLLDMAGRDDAPAQVRADVKTILDSFGVPDLAAWNALGLEGQRVHYEGLTGNLLEYLSTGKAPSRALRDTFRRIKAWLVRWYGIVRDTLNRNHRALFGRDLPILTPELRAVFDRMLASQEAIDLYRDDLSLLPMFQTQEQSGMTDAQWEDYQQAAGMADADAEDALRVKAMRNLRWVEGTTQQKQAEVTAEAKQVRAAVKKQVTQDIAGSPVFRAIRYLKHGDYLAADGTYEKAAEEGQPHKLAIPIVRDMLGIAVPEPRRRRRGKSIVTRIRELGGISRESWDKTFPGERRGEFVIPGVVRGRPRIGETRGMDWEKMAQALREEGYGPQGEGVDRSDHSWLIDSLAEAAAGRPEYAQRDVEQVEQIEPSTVEPHPDAEQAMRKLGYGRYGMLAEVGLHPDEVATFFGFDNGRQLLDAILAAPNLKDAIETETNDRMIREHGELVDEKQVAQAVREAVANEARGRFLALELETLAKGTQPARKWLAAAEEAAHQILGSMPISQITARGFLLAEARAARAAQWALTKNDTQTAFGEKRRQLLNHELARQAAKIEREVADAKSGFAQVWKADAKIGKHRDIDLVRAARALLTMFGLGRGETTPDGWLAPLRAYNAEFYSQRIEPMLAKIASMRARTPDIELTWRDLSWDEFVDLRDTVDSLWFESLRSRQIELDGKKMSRDAFVEEAIARLAETQKKGPAGWDAKVGKKEKAAVFLSGVKAWATRVEHWALGMDGGDHHGPWSRLVRQMFRATTALHSAREQFRTEMRGLLEKIQDGNGQPIDATKWLGYTFENKWELLGALLHIGNQGNLERLLTGMRDKNGTPWGVRLEDGTVDTSRWDEFLAEMQDNGTLTAQHFEFVQAVWDMNERIKPVWIQTWRALFGFYPKEIEAVPVVTKFGTYRGGYMPAKYDWRRAGVQRPGGIEAIEDFQSEVREMLVGQPTFGKERAERVEYPLLLDVKMQFAHMDEVLRFIHLMPVAKDILSVFRDKRIEAALASVDNTIRDQILMPWLKRAVAQKMHVPIGGHAGPYIDKFFAYLRSSVGLSSMFAKVPNAAVQVTGLSNTAVYVPWRYIQRAGKTWASDRPGTAKDVIQLNERMRQRLKNQMGQLDDDLAVMIEPGAWNDFKRFTTRHGYFLQRLVQNPVDIITFVAAFDYSLERQGADRSNAEAVQRASDEAESVVRLAQGESSPESAARFEVTYQPMRLLFQFMGYWNAILNQNLYGPQHKRLRTALFAFMLPTLVGGVIMRALAGGPPDEDHDDDLTLEWAFDMGRELVRGAAATVPLGPQLYELVTKRRGEEPRIAPALSVAGRAWDALVGLGQYLTDTKPSYTGRDVYDLTTAISLMTGLPVAAIGRTLGYAIDVETGRVTPSGTADYVRGLLTGTASPGTR